MLLHMGRLSDSHGNAYEAVVMDEYDEVFLQGLVDSSGQPRNCYNEFHHVASWAEEFGFDWKVYRVETTIENILEGMPPAAAEQGGSA